MTSPLRPEDPTRVGEYELTARIGKGGQGVVYLGRKPGGEPVAVKVMNGAWASDDRQRGRFGKEVEAASRVAAFCTAAVLDCAPDADPPYIVSEYIDGPSLREAVLAEGPRSGTALDRLAIATATALVAIHQAGVVHRDFKPANVLLGPDGPRVIDFGIARSTDATITATRSIVGTPAYMAPEQVRGHEVTFAADVFAWAGVMAFAATGSSPFQGDTLPAVINRVLHEPPRLDEVEAELRPLLLACLDKDPARRPSAVQVLGMLVGHDPATVNAVPVAAVLADGYTAATSEQTRISATAVLPIPTSAGLAAAAAGGAPVEEPPAEPAPTVSGLAGLASPTRRYDGGAPTGPTTGPGSGPLRATTPLGALVGGAAAGGVAAGAGAHAAANALGATSPGAGAVPAPATEQGPGAPHGAEPGAPAAPGGTVPAPGVSPEGGPGGPGTGGGSGGSGGSGDEPVYPLGPGGSGGSGDARGHGLRRVLTWALALGVFLVGGVAGWLLFGDLLAPPDEPGTTPVNDAVITSPEPAAVESPETDPSPTVVESQETYVPPVEEHVPTPQPTEEPWPPEHPDGGGEPWLPDPDGGHEPQPEEPDPDGGHEPAEDLVDPHHE